MEIPPLKKGDKIAIVSPASAVQPEYVEGAVTTLRALGLNPEVMPHALGPSCGSFSATLQERKEDFLRALADPATKAILCSRGGYGCVHLLDDIDSLMSTGSITPKWLIGFSDVTALHSLWGAYGLPSVHGSMAKHLALNGPDDPQTLAMLRLTGGEQTEVILPTGFSGSEAGNRNRCGESAGTVVGGNLAVLGGLIGTRYLRWPRRPILLIEDIAEPIYKVERILFQLLHAGIAGRLGGLIVGQFTDYRHPTADFADVYEMVARFCEKLDCPVAMDVPVGHIDGNIPLLLNRSARLTVTGTQATLNYL